MYIYTFVMKPAKEAIFRVVLISALPGPDGNLFGKSAEVWQASGHTHRHARACKNDKFVVT